MKLTKPSPTEYAPFYASYISLVPEGDITQTLNQQLIDTLSLVNGITEAQAVFRYAEGKWSVKELIGHVIDSERVFGYRALRFARGDETPLAGFDQDVFSRHAAFGAYTIGELAEEYNQVRHGHLSFFGHLEEAAWTRRGKANESEVSVRALAYIMAGHELHHLSILRDRYLARGAGQI